MLVWSGQAERFIEPFDSHQMIVPATELVQGMVYPSEASGLDRSPWPWRLPPFVFAVLLAWVGQMVLANPQTRDLAAPFAVPALVLAGVAITYMFWGQPRLREAGDLVITPRGILQRRPNQVLYIPWNLVEAPHEGRTPASRIIRFRLSGRAGVATGRLQVNRAQADAVAQSPFNPRSGLFTPPVLGRLPESSAYEHASIPLTEVAWPTGPQYANRASREAREPAATESVKFGLTVMLLAYGVVSLAVGYILGSLLLSAVYFFPVLPGVALGRRLAQAKLGQGQALAILVGLALTGPAIYGTALRVLGWATFGYPWAEAIFALTSLAMGVFLGFTFTLFLTKPDLLMENDPRSKPAPFPV
jgi:hypothetical protein